MKLGKAIYTKTSQVIKDGKFVPIEERFEVRVMAVSEGYAMVRRKRAMPFVCRISELKEVS